MSIWNHDYFTKKFKSMPNHLKIVSIGTTQAYFAFDFTKSKVNAFNMAVCLNSFTYSKLLLEKFKQKIDVGAKILITLQYPIFLCDEKNALTIENALQYSKILFGRDPNVSVLKQCIYRILPDSFWSSANFSEVKKLGLRNRQLNHYKPWELERLIQNLIKEGWGKEANCKDLMKCGSGITQEQRKKIEQNKNNLLQIIDLCRENKWIPVLVSLPFSKIFNDKIPEDFKKYCYYQYIYEIAEETNCCFLDYSQDKRMENIHYYMDVWFLNERGRKKFTNIILEEYKEH